jgi:hypothetical protein
MARGMLDVDTDRSPLRIEVHDQAVDDLTRVSPGPALRSIYSESFSGS